MVSDSLSILSSSCGRQNCAITLTMYSVEIPKYCNLWKIINLCTSLDVFEKKSWPDFVPKIKFSFSVILNHLLYVVEHLGKSFLTMFYRVSITHKKNLKVSHPHRRKEK